MKVTIVGGGIGGLGTAIACALRGMQVTVLEQAPALAEVGAGLQISPNGALEQWLTINRTTVCVNHAPDPALMLCDAWLFCQHNPAPRRQTFKAIVG